MVSFFTLLQTLEVGEKDPKALRERVTELDQSEAIERVLLGYSSIWPHNHATAPYILSMTSKFSPIVAHRPGVWHPAAAARYFATLDVLGGSRLAINVVTGGSDTDLRREGDFTPKSERYERASEYLGLMKQAWSQPESFDYAGNFYSAQKVHQLTQPLGKHVPIFMGGDSPDAVEFGARHADLYMLWGEPLAGTKERIDKVREAAAAHDRDMQFSLSLRLFIGDTDEQAWAAARSAEREIQESQGSNKFLRASRSDVSVGRERAMALTGEELYDDCFWTGLTKLLGGFANSQALVGTPERVFDALARYKEIGISAFLVTTGAEAAWDPSLEPFLARARREL
jgi:alkanesulfonate monooxygenase